MNKTLSFLLTLFLTSSIALSTAFGQTPEKMSYQAVIRNSNDVLVANTPIRMQISILQATVDGTVVYSEIQTPTTNLNGLISIEIGIEAGFNSIDWANGPLFIKTETDPTGGTNYSITGTSQLLSVPYALHAKTAENISGILAELDPQFTAWDKSTGISITESQISDLQNYLSTELDPQFASWDKTSGIVITENQILDLQNYLTAELDPEFTSWDKSTGIGITESQISDLQSYLIAELDPQFTAWDKTSGIVITQSQISDLQNYLTVELDPAFTAWDKSTGISITESQISDLQAYLTEESDGSITNEIEMPLDATTGDMSYYNGTNWEKLAAPNQNDMTLNFCEGKPKWTSGGYCPAEIGQYKYGGIVFYVFQEGEAGYVDGEAHGLVCSIVDQSTGLAWSGTTSITTEATGTQVGTGFSNTITIINSQVPASTAAQLCNNLNMNSYNDWFLPSRGELELMYNLRTIINTNATLNGGSIFADSFYWSSTETSTLNANAVSFYNVYVGNFSKAHIYAVRAVRAF